MRDPASPCPGRRLAPGLRVGIEPAGRVPSTTDRRSTVARCRGRGDRASHARPYGAREAPKSRGSSGSMRSGDVAVAGKQRIAACNEVLGSVCRGQRTARTCRRTSSRAALPASRGRRARPGAGRRRGSAPGECRRHVRLHGVRPPGYGQPHRRPGAEVFAGDEGAAGFASRAAPAFRSRGASSPQRRRSSVGMSLARREVVQRTLLSSGTSVWPSICASTRSSTVRGNQPGATPPRSSAISCSTRFRVGCHPPRIWRTSRCPSG